VDLIFTKQQIMKKMAFSILALSLFSCNTQKKAKTDYELSKNETFDVSLKSNPTTGYSWKWIKNNASKKVDSVHSTYIQDKSAAGIAGVRGNEIWKFKAIKTGVDTLTFEYCRSWEPNSTVETKKITVKIN
jgi:inhibitor of cysteine peptidase